MMVYAVLVLLFALSCSDHHPVLAAALDRRRYRRTAVDRQALTRRCGSCILMLMGIVTKNAIMLGNSRRGDPRRQAAR